MQRLQRQAHVRVEGSSAALPCKPAIIRHPCACAWTPSTRHSCQSSVCPRPQQPTFACTPAPKCLGRRSHPCRTSTDRSSDGVVAHESQATIEAGLEQPVAQQEWTVVNFYHLVEVSEPQQLVEQHRAWIQGQGLDVRGRIYISSQGVNAQFGGPKQDALAYTAWFQQDPRFQDLRFSVWPASGPMFPKLRLKYKPNLISLAGGMEGLPITDPSSRATALEPTAWKNMIAEAETRKVVVLDVRNDYEWDAGHFVGAERPAEEIFNETPVGHTETDVPEPLKGLPGDTPVMMYCTGGIRCDVYSTFLRSKGFNNLYTLEGGVQNYLRQQGDQHWNGSLYVFDGRMAISAAAAQDPTGAECTDLPAAVPCQVCGAAAAQLPHMNCANIDCNELFIACAACKTRFGGCCCEPCMSAPRLLRPVKMEGGHYGQWGNYATEEGMGHVMATGRSREGRVARRARRREVIKVKREKQLEERAARKAMVRQAMAVLEMEQAAEAGKPERERPLHAAGAH